MRNVKIKRYVSWYVLILIPIIGTLVFNFYPLLQTFITSLQNMNGKFIGLTNYRIMFASGEFRQTVINTLYMAVLGVAFNIPLAFIIASLLNNIGRGKGVYRVIFLLPMVMSMVTVVTLFKYLMLPNEEGIFNYIIGFLGLEPSLWLNGPGTARESVVFIAVWKGIGYNIILFFAGLQGIPVDMYEAAEIDGANSFKKWLYITIPASKSTFTFVLITSTIAALKRFTEVYAVSMETGNPAGTLETLLLYIYKNSFSTLNYKDEGLAGAASVILFLIILAATLLNSHLTKDKDTKPHKLGKKEAKA
ncbi:sugar ABC transporter permease [Lachnoclostridium pacaense]|uniref:carbohydrate ABC transporter permease n=1 Tax=Enterocloster hominis (ex Hitch et al. 2024) TaxID=1917870 RepID=UPI001D0FD634|nr:sugar ABC transporter permease [Lachnoclostridium pacaense]MCC2877781.1 sugar ABC transporter permease [Lachnoclostridium pacaense]